MRSHLVKTTGLSPCLITTQIGSLWWWQKIKGRKRFTAVDTFQAVIVAQVVAARLPERAKL